MQYLSKQSRQQSKIQAIKNYLIPSTFILVCIYPFLLQMLHIKQILNRQYIEDLYLNWKSLITISEQLKGHGSTANLPQADPQNFSIQE